MCSLIPKPLRILLSQRSTRYKGLEDFPRFDGRPLANRTCPPRTRGPLHPFGNAGKPAADKVVQLHLKFPDVEAAPAAPLRSFRRIHLGAASPGLTGEFHVDGTYALRE